MLLLIVLMHPFLFRFLTPEIFSRGRNTILPCPKNIRIRPNIRYQAELNKDARRENVPLAELPSGRGRVEAYTVECGRAGPRRAAFVWGVLCARAGGRGEGEWKP